jgi:dTDP-4-dehydrorhamnose reductase
MGAARQEKDMIVLLGASGFIGRAFAGELRRRGHCFIPLTRRAFDYTRFNFLFDYLRATKPVFLVNAASYEGSAEARPSARERERMMAANAILPQMIARACLMTKTPWGHVSSGSVYCGAKVSSRGKTQIVRHLGRADLLRLFTAYPERFEGFNELDEPNFSFRQPPCSFFSGAKALAEEAIRDFSQCYLWRLRLPFNGRPEPCNWLWRMARQDQLADTINSFSHLEDCVKACLDLWERRAAFGLYNVTNPGAITMGRIAAEMQHSLHARPRVRHGGPAEAEGAPQSNCILDSSKLLRAGVKLRPVAEALAEGLDGLRLALRAPKTQDPPPAD